MMQHLPTILFTTVIAAILVVLIEGSDRTRFVMSIALVAVLALAVWSGRL